MVEYKVILPPVNLINFNRLRFWMADITMCMDMSCPERLSCYRYQAIPNPYRQSYLAESPRKMDGCDYYSKVKEDDEISSRYRNGSVTQDDSRSSDQGH